MAAIGRPLREVFGDDESRSRLAEDPQAVLREAGYPDLPAALLAQSVVSYAETAPVEVAEHLAPFVTAHSGIVTADPAAGSLDAGLDLLATAPAGGPDPMTGPDPLDTLDPSPAPPAYPAGGPEGEQPPVAGFGAGEPAAVPGGPDGDELAFMDGAPLDVAFGEGDRLQGDWPLAEPAGGTAPADAAGAVDPGLPATDPPAPPPDLAPPPAPDLASWPELPVHPDPGAAEGGPADSDDIPDGGQADGG